jgi:hypothetical protein
VFLGGSIKKTCIPWERSLRRYGGKYREGFGLSLNGRVKVYIRRCSDSITIHTKIRRCFQYHPTLSLILETTSQPSGCSLPRSRKARAGGHCVFPDRHLSHSGPTLTAPSLIEYSPHIPDFATERPSLCRTINHHHNLFGLATSHTRFGSSELDQSSLPLQYSLLNTGGFRRKQR